MRINTLTLKPFNWIGSYLKPLIAVLKIPEKLALVLITLNLCITLPLAYTLNIWFDEAYTLNTSEGSLEYAIHQAIYFEEQAPLYFVLVTLWRKLNASIFFARLFSVLCISITIYIATLISKKLFKNIHPGWVTTAVAFNPFIIWAAVEIRLFAFSILLSAIALLLFSNGYLDTTPRPAVRWLHTLICVLILYTHYFLAFSIAAYGITLLCLRRKQTFFSYCSYMIIVGVSFIPMILLIADSQQVASWTDNTATQSGHIFFLAESLRTSFAAALLYLLPAKIGDPSPAFWRLLRLLFLASLLVFVLAYRRSIGPNSLAIWIITLTISTLFFILFEIFTYLGLNDSIQHYRHTISLLIPVLFSVVAVFSLIQQERTRRTALTIWLSFTLLLNLTSINLTFSSLAKNGDYIRVASYLMENETPNQPILVFNPEVEMALSRYYKGVNRLIPLPKKEEFQTYDLSALTLESERQILTAFPQVPGEQLIWLVTDTSSIKDQLGYRLSYQILNEFVRKHYFTQSNQDFYGTNIKLLH